MPRSPRPLPPTLPQVFTAADASTAGVTRGRLSASDLDAPFRGVRVRRDTDGAAPHDEDTPDEIARRNILGRVRAHALVLPPPAFYTGTTALAIHGLPFPDADAAASADLDVAVPAPHRALRRTGITAVQISPMLVHTTVRAGLPVATPASAWAMLAREHTVRDLVVIGDAIIRVPRDGWGRRLPDAQHAGLEKLAAAVSAGRRCGIAKLRAALPLLRTGSMSPLETDWRLSLIGTGLPEPELDVEVRAPDGRLLGISDGAFVTHRVAIEIEGDHHRTSRRQWVRDLEKYSDYANLGWDVVRLSAAHIRHDPSRGVALVRAALARRGWHA
ncbi:hypothetical protein JOE53_002232 [Microbacterium laevaniformans]|uniref:hypothetical protein n=1 Tax=Microbacterium laevaniformans TaxID=36807 RepID=UPI001959BB35|nr:hypothetical protein [Microbacterium laevaniformans]MBM7753512.1 hypothetical protein [Microbacterium laevaniformans]